MDDKQVQNEKHNGNRWTPAIIAIVSAAVGSSGGIWLSLGSPYAQEAVAPDRFTGTQAAALKNRIDYHLENHPDHDLDIRVTRLETQYEIILNNQQRILDRLEK